MTYLNDIINTKSTPYLEAHQRVNELIERFSQLFDYTPGFISRIYYTHILTHDWISQHRPYSNTSLNTDPVKEYTDTGIQTSRAEFISQIPLTTYINIRKCLDKLQRQQRLENQRSVGTDTETKTVDISISTHNSFGLDISVWLYSPYQTPEWLSQLYEPEEEASLELARQATLREIFQSDSEYITASEPTSESPLTHTEIDMSLPP